ncbi:MAG TPA: histone deacetylase [Thermomicrobiales bacterium]|nr:histone deacetylase [Thermomicrobiales bacterium]
MNDSACAILISPAFLGHDTGHHPENPHRITAIQNALAERDLLTGRELPVITPATMRQAGLVHSPRYLDRLLEVTHTGGAWLDADTMCADDSLEVALLAAGAAITAVDLAVSGKQKRAFAMGRPPGHHATANRAMGFCLINSIAVAAQHARNSGVERIAIVDWDVHHGNGTQDIFYERADVLFVSLHHYGNFYPGTGSANERGTGKGEGYTLNIPLAAGTGDTDYLAHFRDTVGPALVNFHPDLILVSAGFDAHARDPLGGMRVSTAGFGQMAAMIREWSENLAEGRLVAVLEGGYDLTALADSVCTVVETLD